jgi:hypothetical protein
VPAVRPRAHQLVQPGGHELHELVPLARRRLGEVGVLGLPLRSLKHGCFHDDHDPLTLLNFRIPSVHLTALSCQA